ncbi:hypothetical protein like AT3G47570 [Hibiscus trionum]|uniref:non-specific serine/threonine protein kinase n=1 Tax=Hibiscus trionum TaxID=183268 RepID=A0A9W7M7D5_HIBTR|nr:hypothetical protein like AT3G47570 [Hibiscus trionum]
MIKFHLLSHALTLIHCFMFNHAAIVRNLTTDQRALLAFKHQIDDPRNLLASNWSANSSVCSWAGVSCAAKHGRVRGLDLSNMNLTGTIPPQLGNLSFLASLNLSYNNLHGPLPRELGQLNRLKLIDLSNNFFTGGIPASIDGCEKLQTLYLHTNRFDGSIPRSIGNLTRLTTLYLGEIPSEIGNLKSLEILYVSNNSLSGEIPQEIGNLQNLEILYFDINNLSGQIPTSIDGCRNLQELYLDSNSLNGSIPKNIGNLTQLTMLYLGDNNFEGEIPPEIGNLRKLNVLLVSDNYLSGEIPWEIGNLERLEILSARHMSLVGSIPTSIFNISSLINIVLQVNRLSGKLPDLTALSNLELLNLYGNSLNGNIPDSISNVSKLQILELEGNSFTGLIPNSLGSLKFLEQVYLRSNHLTTHESSIFHSLQNCTYLTVLILSFNPLNCILPTSLSNLPKSLQYFEAKACNIRGSIPMEIASLNNVISLDLSTNELSGSVPATMGNLRNLQLLDLSENKLQGSISHELCGLKGLYELSLAANQLHGPLPACLGDFISLRRLNFSSNKLHSLIPSRFWSLEDILEVDLASNYFNGSLPMDIGNLKVLIVLNLSRNLFSGDIPPAFGSLTDLQDLLLSRNGFEGPITESFGDLKSLVKLDLSDNHLSGVIPKSLEKLSYLRFFNVSDNRLEGEIPDRGCFVNFTSKSFMENYALCGSPRLQVQPCKSNIHRQSNRPLLNVLKYVLPIFGSIIVLVASVIVYKKWQKKSTSLTIVEADVVPVKTWRRMSYHQLSEATDGFMESNLLGSGSFGSVYKGLLSDGTEVAVKVFNLEIDGAYTSFDVECEVMGKILHRNLVKVITCCSNVDFKALVLEFMPNGSLEKWLYSDNHALDILQRIDIAIDVALALEYLHSGFHVPIIHCDLKPSNVLLDKDMVAHVGDFGIAKLLGEGDSIKQTMTLATIGYMAPEYGSAGIISVKSDVYSYGILLMETFTGKKPTDERFAGEMSMKHWVKMSVSDGINGVGDSSIVQEEDQYFVVKANCISSIMELALNCSAELPEDRMDMKNVASKLKNIKRNLLNNIGES